MSNPILEQLLVKWLYPTCIACPDHAKCISPGSDPVCPPEYILRSHPLSFNNLFPLTPSCILNKAQEYQSLQVADAAENMLHKRAGQEECRSSTRPQPSAELIARQRFSVSELRKEIESLKDVRCLHAMRLSTQHSMHGIPLLSNQELTVFILFI
jgi:hypothetical protein